MYRRDAQDIFNEVKTHLLKQNAQALNGNHCVYRAPDGKKCAVGCLIPDEEYNPQFEGKSVGSLCSTLCSTYGVHEVVLTSERIAEFKPHLELLQVLQGLHDGGEIDGWPDGLERIATEFKLHNDPVSE